MKRYCSWYEKQCKYFNNSKSTNIYQTNAWMKLQELTTGKTTLFRMFSLFFSSGVTCWPWPGMSSERTAVQGVTIHELSNTTRERTMSSSLTIFFASNCESSVKTGNLYFCVCSPHSHKSFSISLCKTHIDFWTHFANHPVCQTTLFASSTPILF